MPDKILLVDDEIAILEGYQRLLRREFQPDIAVGAAAALAMIADNGPYAVIVSDMRMPEMDGAQLLARIKSISPETIRVMLTGNADIQTAVTAVNDGAIFRFLTKPCTKETLSRTLTASLVQFRLTSAEKELLEKTLHGSIQVLTEVLSLVNPAAFGRAQRVRRYIRHIVQKLKLENPWRFEVAAMMSQLGCVTLDPETIERVYRGTALSPEEQESYDSHPQVAHDLLAHIPRMEPIAWLIAHQNRAAAFEGDLADREMADMRTGAAILRATLTFDDLLSRGLSRTEAAHRVSRQQAGLDPRVFEALVELEPEATESTQVPCKIVDLALGMILGQELRTGSGALVMSKDQEITMPLILKLKALLQKGAIGEAVMVSQPVRAAAAAAP